MNEGLTPERIRIEERNADWIKTDRARREDAAAYAEAVRRLAEDEDGEATEPEDEAGAE